jgi:hypothetical protein
VGGSIRPKDYDELANGISHAAPDAGPVDIDSIPAGDDALFIAPGTALIWEPAIFSVEANAVAQNESVAILPF